MPAGHRTKRPTEAKRQQHSSHWSGLIFHAQKIFLKKHNSIYRDAYKVDVRNQVSHRNKNENDRTIKPKENEKICWHHSTNYILFHFSSFWAFIFAARGSKQKLFQRIFSSPLCVENIYFIHFAVWVALGDVASQIWKTNLWLLGIL
jgi:hypothetical protein